MKNAYYQQKLENLPVGVCRTVGDILLERRGIDRAISRKKLIQIVAEKWKKSPSVSLDRSVRRAIEVLRTEGWLIGSSLDGEGYYMVTSQEEYAQFRAQYTSRAFQVIETVKSMDMSAKREFGDPAPRQMPLLPVEGER